MNTSYIRLILGSVLVFLPVILFGAGFDCRKSHTFVEQAICGNKELSKLDTRLNTAYKDALNKALDPETLRQEQWDWLTNERNICQDDDCLKRAYKQRLRELVLYKEQQRASSGEDACKFADLHLPKDYSIFAAGGFSLRHLDFPLDQSGALAIQMDVIVNYASKPVVLMLGTYNPTIWNLHWTPSTRIVAVVVSGYHRQAVAGLDPSVPVLNTTYDNKGICGYFDVRENDLATLNPFSRRLFGRPVDMVYLAKNSVVVIGNALSKNAHLITSPSITPESFRDKNAPKAGQAGIVEAVCKGELRKATDADADAWVVAVAACTPHRDIPPVTGGDSPKPDRPRLDNAFVVLKPFTYPPGLLIENPTSFFIPKGVPKPKGDHGQSHVYDFNELKCQGQPSDR